MFVLITVALFFVFIALKLIIVGHRYRTGQLRRVPPAPDHKFDQSQAASFMCGARVGTWRASFPLCKVKMDAAHLRISGVVPTANIERDRVTRVQKDGYSGIRFISVDGRYDGVEIWTLDGQGVLGTFARFGWPVG